jgi:hydrogenase nickel incorporation protein HypA/HybF
VHEYSLIQSLMERVEAEARERNALAIRRLRVRVGELSGVEPELLATAYEIFRAGTLCAQAELDIERVPARWACRRCGAAVVSGGILQCPSCGEPAALVEGQDIVLERIELEVP